MRIKIHNCVTQITKNVINPETNDRINYRFHIFFFLSLFQFFSIPIKLCFGSSVLICCGNCVLILQGKIAVISGGDSGIGRAVCNMFALEGATVAFTYVKGEEDKDARDTLEMIKAAMTGDAKDPLAIPCDLGFDENCKRVVDEVVSAYGHIDILVNNAAEQYECTSVEEIDEQRLERVFRTNIFSYFFMTRSLQYIIDHWNNNKKRVNCVFNLHKKRNTCFFYLIFKTFYSSCGTAR